MTKKEEQKCDPRNQIVAINRKLNITFKILGEKSTIFDLISFQLHKKKLIIFFSFFSGFVCIQEVKKNETLGLLWKEGEQKEQRTVDRPELNSQRHVTVVVLLHQKKVESKNN